MSVIKSFFKWNYKASMAFDDLFLNESYTTYGTSDFHKSLIPTYITEDAVIYDVGGGKCPHIFPDVKKEKKLTTIGVDIDAEELSRAPKGGYDRTICADITARTGDEDGDFVISRATLEHVKDARAAILNMATFIKPGGRIIAFAPCRNAWFARLNMILPEGFKNKLIHYFYDDAGLADVMGFKAYYSHGTPKEMDKIMEEAGLKIIEKRLYYMSNYFAFFFPVYMIWRFYQMIMRATGSENFCEGFAYVCERRCA
jgi:SAM-dependent methyltransferase